MSLKNYSPKVNTKRDLWTILKADGAGNEVMGWSIGVCALVLVLQWVVL
jgi:hypothetical protein